VDLTDNPAAKGFEFPTDMVVIAVGPATLEFRNAVEAALVHAGTQRTSEPISTRESKGGHYLSIHVPVHFATREAMQAAYAAVNQVPGLRFKF
jgi:uncharacterized protein